MPRRPGLFAALSGAALLAGCTPSDGQDWHGYTYPDVMSDAPPHVSGPYSDGPQCLAALRSANARAASMSRPRSAGFACARGCSLSAQDKGSGDRLVTDCQEVLR
ncbi:hypothetical protein [Novosphingobium rosa]|uniref:hypothetical protein n=1 Tax=Novosphingobium rosa TaxID=76978 RepID=UPI00082BDFF9|nr:hypothetical protein [Novosphingobium rosa]